MKKKDANKPATWTVWDYILLAIMVYFTVKCVSVAMTQPFSFDGAITAQLCQNIAENMLFSLKYSYLSANYVSTGAPVYLPVALNFKIAGQGFTQGLFVNAAYIIMFFTAVICLLKRSLRLDPYIVLCWALIFFATPGLFDLGFGLYGEIPMLFFMVLGIIYFEKYEKEGNPTDLAWMGLLWGLGFLTKTVFLIAAPGLALALMAAAAGGYRHFKPGKKFYKALTGFAAGFLAPSIVNEAFKFFVNGAAAHLTNWKWYLVGAASQSGMMKTGASIQDTYGFFNKIETHVGLLASFTRLDERIIIFLLCFLSGMLISMLLYVFGKIREHKTEKKMPFSTGEVLILAVTVTYFVWWIFITPTARAWHRRIFDGIILYGISAVIMVRILIRAAASFAAGYHGAGKRLMPFLPPAAALLALLGMASMLLASGNHRISFVDSMEKQDLLSAGKFIRSLPPEAQFYGFAWWQAPNVSFIAGRNFKNIFTDEEMLRQGVKSQKFLVFDREALTNESICYKRILSDHEHALVFSNKEAAVYRLDRRNRVREYDECQ